MTLTLTQKTVEIVKDQVQYVAALHQDKAPEYNAEQSKLFAMESLLESMGILIEYNIYNGEDEAKVTFSLKTEINTDGLPT